LDANGDHCFRPDSTLAQTMRELIGSEIQLGISKRSVATSDGDMARFSRRLLFDELVNCLSREKRVCLGCPSVHLLRKTVRILSDNLLLHMQHFFGQTDFFFCL